MPITELVVNSLITNPTEGQTLAADKPMEIRGVAWDGGHGIAQVEVSTDGGVTWQPAALKQNYGRFSWRQWQFTFEPKRPGNTESWCGRPATPGPANRWNRS